MLSGQVFVNLADVHFSLQGCSTKQKIFLSFLRKENFLHILFENVVLFCNCIVFL